MKFQLLIALIICTFVIFSYNVTADLVAHWSLDDGTGKDNFGNNDGTLEGNPTKEANGKVNGALAFDGDGDYVQTSLMDELQTGENFSISLWFRANNTSQGEQHMIWIGAAPGNGWGTEAELHMGLNHPKHHDKLTFYFGSSTDISGQSINMVSEDEFTDTSDWHHLVGAIESADGPTVYGTMYLDGKLLKHLEQGADLVTTASTEVPPDRNGWNTNLRIGAPADVKRYFDGLIDEVAVWDHTLTQEEAALVMANGVTMAVEPVGKLTTAWGAIK